MLWNWLVYAAVFNFAPDPAVSQLPEPIPCEKGWFYFRDKCYTVGDKIYTYPWKESADRCVAMGGHLATIDSEEVNDFLVTFLLLDIKKHVWIGLNDINSESQYTWHDGSVSNFRKWRPTEPNPKYTNDEDCVELNFDPANNYLFKWNDITCTYNHLGSICQKKKENRKISPDPRFCSPDLGGGWKHDQSCYHLIQEEKTWLSAEQHCKKNFDGGNLVTVLDIAVDKFLDYIQSDLDEEVWIGIKIKDHFQQHWSSGWYVGYSGFSDELRGFREGYCVARNKFKQWSVVRCSKKLFFICETSKTKPPVLPKPPPGSHCPEGIKDLKDPGGEYCYFIDGQSRLTWSQANFECARMGGSLAIINSKELSDILHPIVKYSSWHAVFIGLIRSVSEGQAFIWVDGSALDFQNWEKHEPNSVEEKCGEIVPRTMQWNDNSCAKESGYICSIRKIRPASTNIRNNNYPSIIATVDVGTCSGLYDVMLRCLYRTEKDENITCYSIPKPKGDHETRLKLL